MSWRSIYNLLVFDELDSTSSEGIRIAKTCPDENYVILAKNQTASRGRNGKIWYSNLGNLNLTILLKHNIDLVYIPQLSFVTSVVVLKTISSLAYKVAERTIKLKWPNDILINKKKVSGILLEAISINNNHYIAIGIGINVKHSPLNVEQLTTNLSDENIEVKDLESLLDVIMINFEKYLNKWKEQGFAKIRQYWLKNVENLGQIVTINDKNTKIQGIFNGISQDGAMQLQLDSGQVLLLVAN